MLKHIKVVGPKGSPVILHRDEVREVIPVQPGWPIYNEGARSVIRLPSGGDIQTRTSFEEIEGQLQEDA